MIVGIGIDICEIKRISKVLEKFNTRFENRCFTERERIKCRKAYDMSSCYAKRFAAKEAFLKAIGTGLSKGFKFNDITIINNSKGKPLIELEKKIQLFIKKKFKIKKYQIHLSISDEKRYSIAYVILNESLK